jgi:REP element-mobilizing transposase RayT
VSEIENPERKYHRRSVRLKDYDYSQSGAYFITICTKNRKCLFGAIVDGAMRLNECGEVVQKCWREIPCHFPGAQLDEFVIMPNHIQGIVFIIDCS